jgi:hypothetical protein
MEEEEEAMANRTVPTHRVVMYRHEYGFRVAPGVLNLVKGVPACVRFVNVSGAKLQVVLGKLGGSFGLSARGKSDVPVNTSTVGDFPYTVGVVGVGIVAEGGSGPRIIITP